MISVLGRRQAHYYTTRRFTLAISQGAVMKTVIHELTFKVTPKILFELYMDSKKHSMATGAKAVMSRKAGGSFKAHHGYIGGKNLLIIPNKMIVQTWRGSDWPKSEEDSIFILSFKPIGKGTEMTMVHTNLSQKQAIHVNKGWHDFYWTPWKKYLAKK
jgi:activator of HSP90 ATPase